MLGLRDEVRSHQNRVGGVVGDDRDLGRSGLAVDADNAPHHALCLGHPDVPRAGDDVDGLHALDPVGEHRDRLRTPSGVHLVDAEQRASGQDRGVRPAVIVRLRWAHDGHGLHAGHPRRHHVHHHARGVDRPTTRHVQSHAAYRPPGLTHDRAWRQLGHPTGGQLIGMHDGRAFDGSQQSRPNIWMQAPLGRCDHLNRDPQTHRASPVETLPELQHRLGPTRPDILQNVMHRGRLPLGQGPGHVERLIGGQVDPAQHGSMVFSAAAHLCEGEALCGPSGLRLQDTGRRAQPAARPRRCRLRACGGQLLSQLHQGSVF